MTVPSKISFSHYRVLSQIGAGGMGEVFLAEDTRLNRKVALKILPENLASDKERLLRFEQEAKAASALNHPNILTIFEFGCENETHFLATEFIEGETLRERLQRGGLTLSETLDTAAQIASALSAAHEAGIIHRDIKPENVMIRADSLVKVLDFGLAKAVENVLSYEKAETRLQVETQAGMILGTAAYMSPEQARGKRVDARSDIFSFGCVLYEMLAGRQPFTGETINHTIIAVLEKDPPPLSSSVAHCPPEIERILDKTLAKKPEERYRSAREMFGDLKELKEELSFRAKLKKTSRSDPEAENPTRIIKSAANVRGETQTSSIAVLPFANISADEENEYFCDGLAEELLNALAKIEDLKVAARTSAFSFKNKNIEVSKIGQALNVKTILEGSVRRAGNQLRITVQLVNASNGYHLWSERYDREMKGIFDVQDEITLAVVDALKLKLLGDEKAALLKRYTDNTEAYEFYLKGLYHFNKWTTDGLRRSLDFFEQATGKEPEFAPAYAKIADYYGFLSHVGLFSPREIFPKWKAATERALEIDDRLADAHVAMAHIYFFYERDWEKAEREFVRAIELNPNDSYAHRNHGLFLVSTGKFDRAFDECKKALELDPLSPVLNLVVGFIYLFAGRLDEARGQLRRLNELEPNSHNAYWFDGELLLADGKYEEAIAMFQKALALSENQLILSKLGYTYGLAGKRDKALSVLGQLLNLRERQYAAAFNVARVYAGLGETDKTFEWLEKALEERNGELAHGSQFIKAGSGMYWGEKFLADPRYRDILRRIGFSADLTIQDKMTNEASEARTAIFAPATTNDKDAAVPLDVRKVSNFPADDSKLSGGYAAAVEAQPQEIGGNLSERHSLSAHQTTQPQKQSEPSQETSFDRFGNRKLFLIIGVTILLLAAIGFGVWYVSKNPASKQISSIAVLPFENASGNADLEYLSDGMTETLISSLSQLPNLNVKARSSVFRYKGKSLKPPEIGKELNAQALLNGVVIQRGQDLILNVELIDAQTENVLWSANYNRRQTDLVSLQTEIARDVSQKLKTKLSGADEQKLAKSYTANPEAYKLYLQGRFYWNKRAPEDIKKSIGYFNQAITLDPNYALAYAGLSDAYSIGSYYGVAPPREAMPKAKEAALKALSLDDQLSEAHAALALIMTDYDYDFAGAERECKRAIELNPNNATANLFCGVLLYRLGRFEESFAQFKRALELEPLSLPINRQYGEALFFARRYDEAITQLKKTAELDSNHPFTYFTLANVYRMKGN